MKKRKLSLCLSGGGARGLAHIGVVKYLVENNISYLSISGTSAGAMIGAFLCDDFHPSEIEEIILKQLKKPKINLVNFKEGLLNISFLKEVLKNNLRTTLIENLPKQLYVNATNFQTGESVTFNSGNLIEIVLASSSIPIVFEPIYINGTPYVDGGLSCNINVTPFINNSNKILGVNVNPIIDYNKKLNLVSQIDRLIQLSIKENSLLNIKQCDFYI
jgi:NTE family protein